MLSTILAVMPLLALVYLLLFRGVRLLNASGIVAAITLLLVLIYWEIRFLDLFWVSLKALSLTFDIFLIVLGALFFQGFLKLSGHFQMMIDELNKLTSSRWLLILILSWSFGAFLEGISGFGAPAALLAPFLVGLGLLPFEAIVICLLANSTAVTFGAMGTPLRVGLSGYLNDELVSMTSFMNLCVGVIIPLMMIHFLRLKKIAPTNTIKPYLWAIGAGLSLLIPYYLISFIAIEFPSVIGGGLSFFIMIFIVKGTSENNFSVLKLLKSFYPYWPVIILLFLGRYLFADYGLNISLGKYFSHHFIFFHPGFILLLVVIILGRLTLKSFNFIFPLYIQNKNKMIQTTLSLFFMSSISTLYLATEFTDKRGMLSVIGDMLGGELYRYYAVFLGTFGSFLTGSATVSNLLFGPLQVEMADTHHLNRNLILALQLSGASMGNMISLLNIISVEGAIGVTSNLKQVFSYLLPYCFIALLLFVGLQLLR
ncbi:MAG: L-lactate permease [Bacteriovoracaceae bacterium]